MWPQNRKQESSPVGVVISLEDGKHRDASVKPLVEKTRGDMDRVNQLILSKAGSDVAMIPEVANHLISSGGKRLRPMLTLASATMFGYSGDCHVKLATSVEFMHTATLLHDDVVDESDLRRGRSTARMIWGNQASVLVGDFLLGQAFKMMVEVGSLEALDVLSTAAAVIAEGEVLQLVGGQEHGNHRRRLSFGDPRQDGGAVFGGLRSRADHCRTPARPNAMRCAPTGSISAWRSS
jgi:hypothetical protein